MSSRTSRSSSSGGILLFGVLDGYDLLPTSRSRRYAYVTSLENYQLSMNGSHRCRIHALVPTKILKTKPSAGERHLLRGATPVEVSRSGYCGHIAKTWQLVKVDLREPEEVDFELTPNKGLVSMVLLIGLGLVVLGSRLARGPGR